MMIEKTDAYELFARNLHRTNMLLEAVDKIRAYDRLYRVEQTDQDLLKLIEKVQSGQFEQIQQACGEHAVISLATSFETYCKEFLQQLLFEFPYRFSSMRTRYSDKLAELISSDRPANYELIEAELNLRSRFDYYDFFKTYDIKFLSTDEKEFIEYIYLKRNNYVHNAGRADTKTQKKLEVTFPPYNEHKISTEAKRLRTRLERIIQKSHNQTIACMSDKAS